METEFRFSEPVVKLIDDLQVKMRCKSREEVIRKALALLRVAANNQDKDGKIRLITPTKDLSIVL